MISVDAFLCSRRLRDVQHNWRVDQKQRQKFSPKMRVRPGVDGGGWKYRLRCCWEVGVCRLQARDYHYNSQKANATVVATLRLDVRCTYSIHISVSCSCKRSKQEPGGRWMNLQRTLVSWPSPDPGWNCPLSRWCLCPIVVSVNAKRWK